jgi:hypothetical protein
VQVGGATDYNQIHRTMCQKRIEILIWLTAMLAAKFIDLVGIAALNRGDFNSRDGASGTCVRFSDISAADKTEVNGHDGLYHADGLAAFTRATMNFCLSSEPQANQ